MQKTPLKETLADVEKLHSQLFSHLLETKERVSKLELRDVCTVGYCAKEIAKLLKDLRIEYDKLSELAQRIACLRWVQLQEDAPEKIETELYKCRPDLQMSANIPSHSKEPEKYIELLKWIGVEEAVASTGLLRVHWPTLKEVITEQQSLGKPLPAGISADKTHAHYTIKYRSKGGSGE